MNAAVILHADSPILQQTAAELNSLLAGLTNQLQSLEVWVLYQSTPPTTLPTIVSPITSIRLLKTGIPEVPESILHILLSKQNKRQLDMLFFTSDGLGQELCTRLAYRLEGSSALSVETCFVADGKLEVLRRVYGNNLTARFRLDLRPYCVSVAKKAVHSVAEVKKNKARAESEPLPPLAINWLRDWEMHPVEVDSELTGAEIVLALGNGVKNRENVERLQVVADTIGAQIGVSRPVAMSGWLGMDRLIGISGHLISPRICIAAGVSGSSVFCSGIEHSRILVAINSDSQAAIFNIADVGIVDDLFAVLFELESIVKKAKERDNCLQLKNQGPGN